ncbi:2457_t:CDS:2, partial [Gigaspora margarita]
MTPMQIINWNDKIDSAKYLSKDQKDQLHRLRNKRHIENEAFIGNLLDGNLFDTLISNDALLSDQQKKDLQELRKQRITTLSNKTYDELKNNIRIERIVSKLEDKG